MEVKGREGGGDSDGGVNALAPFTALQSLPPSQGPAAQTARSLSWFLVWLSLAPPDLLRTLPTLYSPDQPRAVLPNHLCSVQPRRQYPGHT